MPWSDGVPPMTCEKPALGAELGGDFTFVGERYRLQVGGRDFFVDLVFFHRGLYCLVAFELKVEQFEPAAFTMDIWRWKAGSHPKQRAPRSSPLRRREQVRDIEVHPTQRLPATTGSRHSGKT